MCGSAPDNASCVIASTGNDGETKADAGDGVKDNVVNNPNSSCDIKFKDGLNAS